MVAIITRAQWRAPTGIPAGRNVPLASRRWFVVHWPGSAVGADAAQVVRNIDNFHRRSNGWAVIGYNFLVSRDGRIFEGAGLMTRGIHEPSRNTDGFGVCVMISVGETPPQAALNATRALYNWLNGRTGRTLSRGFHGQFSATGCAGPALNAWVRAGMPATGGAPAPPAGGPPGVPAFPGRILRQPPIMRGEDVRTWQLRVRQRPDLPNIDADGAFGPVSEGAARTVQGIARLPVDGRVGPNTWPATWTTGASPVTSGGASDVSNFQLSITPHRRIRATWTRVPDTAHYVINFYPASGARVTERLPQPPADPVRLDATFPLVPGRLEIHAIVGGRPVLVGIRTFTAGAG